MLLLLLVSLILCGTADDSLAAGPVAKKLVPKAVDQSSNEGMQYAKYLTDAKGSKTCAQTRKELHPWQRVVLPMEYIIQDVLVMGTAKSLMSRSVTILVNLYNSATGKFIGECGRITAGSAAFSKTLSCRKMKGSAILLQTQGNHGMAYLRTCNIVVRGYADVPKPISVIHARGAEQVGTTDKKGANLIIDGKVSTCSYTSKEKAAWQRVYYDGQQSISSVMIAGSARSSRILGRSKITIEVNVMKGNQKFGLCGIFQVASGKKYTQNLNCKGFKGDNIRIEVTDGTAYLMTCEVVTKGRKA